MMTVITAINPLTGVREDVSLPMAESDARRVINQAKHDPKTTYTNYQLRYTMTTKLGDLPKPTRSGLAVDIDRADFALSLKTYRLRQGLTQAQLGERWGVSRFLIIKAESAKDISWQSAYKLFAKLANELEHERK